MRAAGYRTASLGQPGIRAAVNTRLEEISFRAGIAAAGTVAALVAVAVVVLLMLLSSSAPASVPVGSVVVMPTIRAPAPPTTADPATARTAPPAVSAPTRQPAAQPSQSATEPGPAGGPATIADAGRRPAAAFGFGDGRAAGPDGLRRRWSSTGSSAFRAGSRPDR